MLGVRAGHLSHCLYVLAVRSGLGPSARQAIPTLATAEHTSGLWPRCGACGPPASCEVESRASPLPRTPAPFVVWESCCGSGLRPRCGACGPLASCEVESRASPLPPNSDSVRGLGELLWERPLAAMRCMRAAGFVRSCIAGKPAPTKPRLRCRFERALVGAASGRDAVHAGRRLRSRLNRGQARSHEPRLRSWFGRAVVGAASGRDAVHAGRRLRSRLNRGQARSHEPRLRSWFGRAVVGAASGRDATHAGRGLRSRLNRGQARSHHTRPRCRFARALAGAARALCPLSTRCPRRAGRTPALRLHDLHAATPLPHGAASGRRLRRVRRR